MTSQQNGYYKEMYMVPPSIWENIKKCVNDHEKRILYDLNKPLDDTIPSRNITLPDVSISKDPTPNPNPNDSQSTFHRSQDRSRSILESSLPHSITQQFSLPDESISSTKQSSKIDISNITDPNPSFGRIPVPKPDSSLSFNKGDISNYENFRPPRTSTPNDTYEPYFPIPAIPQPQPTPQPYINPPPPSPSQYIDPIVPVPVRPFPNCLPTNTAFNRSMINTRTRTGILDKPNITNQFRCQYCNKTFARKWNLKKHILTIHKQQNLPDPGEPAPTVFKRKVPDTFNEPEYKRREYDRWQV